MQFLFCPTSWAGKGWINPRKITVSCRPAEIYRLPWLQGYSDNLTPGISWATWVLQYVKLGDGPPAWI